MEQLQKATWKIEAAGMSWLGIACAVLIIVGIIVGYIRGLVKELVSLAIVFVSIALVWFLNPYINRFLREETLMESKIATETRSLIENNIGDEMIVTGDAQDSVIENLGLPKFLTDSLLKNNNAEGYRALNVSSFLDYVSEYVADIIVNALSFLITFLAVSLLLRILVFVLDIFTRLPVISGLNALGGALLGGAKYVIFIWIAMLVVTVLIRTDAGRNIMNMIEHDRFLSFLYSFNPIFRFFVNVF